MALQCLEYGPNGKGYEDPVPVAEVPGIVVDFNKGTWGFKRRGLFELGQGVRVPTDGEDVPVYCGPAFVYDDQDPEQVARAQALMDDACMPTR